MFPSGVFNAFSSSNSNRQNNDYHYHGGFDRFLQEERDRYQLALVHSLAEQERRRRELDMIQKQLYMKEMERRRNIADKDLEQRREMEIRQYLQKKQEEEERKRAHFHQKVPMPLYHGRLVQGPDGHQYKIMYLHSGEDHAPSTTNNESSKIRHDHNQDNPQSAVGMVSMPKSLEQDSELKQFIFDTDDIEDKAKFVHVDFNTGVERMHTNASDVSVCQGRNLDDSISTHPGIFDHKNPSQLHSSPPKTMEGNPNKSKVKGTTPKMVHPTVSKSAILDQDHSVKIVQGVDGKFYKVLEEIDSFGKSASVRREPKVNKLFHTTAPNQEEDELVTPVMHDLKQGYGKKDTSSLDESNTNHFTDFYHEYPNMDRILQMLFDVVPEQVHAPQDQSQQLPSQQLEERSSASSPRLNVPLKSSIKTVPSRTSRMPLKNVTRVMRGPDGRLYQLKVDAHQDEKPPTKHPTASHSMDNEVDARGEPKYHHIRGPDGHLYKVKNVHYHEKYLTPSSEQMSASDGDKTPTHENREFVEDQLQKESNKGNEQHERFLQRHHKLSQNIPKDEKIDGSQRLKENELKGISFYDTIAEEETFEPPQPVMDHVNEMSCPYEFIEGKDGMLHDMNHEVIPNLSMRDDNHDNVQEDDNEKEILDMSLDQKHSTPIFEESHKDRNDSKVQDQNKISFFNTIDDHIGDVEDASDSEKEDEFITEEHNLRPIWGQWLEPANEAELHKTEVLRSHNQ